MRYFIGWCHENEDCPRFNAYVFSTHWHWWNGVDMSAGIMDAKRYETVEEAELALVEILILHPERYGQMTIEKHSGITCGH